MTKIINLTPHDITIVGVTDMDRDANRLHHSFPDNAESNTACVHCGTWRDEACDVPCKLIISRSGSVARVEESTECRGEIIGIPIIKKWFGHITDLPKPEPNTIYIVSLVTAQAVAQDVMIIDTFKGAVPRRNDVYIVGETIRDEKGNIIGAKSLAVI